MTKEEQRAYYAAYHASHKEEARAYSAAHRDEMRACSAAHYEANRADLLEKQAKLFAEFTEWLKILRTNNGCEDCETHEGRLVHHHVDPSTKKFNISRMYSFSLDTLEDELEKCVVLCEPCHKRRHVEMCVVAA